MFGPISRPISTPNVPNVYSRFINRINFDAIKCACLWVVMPFIFFGILHWIQFTQCTVFDHNVNNNSTLRMRNEDYELLQFMNPIKLGVKMEINETKQTKPYIYIMKSK